VGASNNIIATAIEILLNHQELTAQDADVVAAALEHFRQRPAVVIDPSRLAIGERTSRSTAGF
jgi:predicted nucleic-acid-binding protein